MKRKNFLRQMAVTLPVGLAAPQMLFAGSETSGEAPENLILVTDEASGAVPEVVSRFKKIGSASIARLQFDKGSFLIVDKAGKQYRAGKLVFSGNVSLNMDAQKLEFNHTPSVSVEFGEDKRSAGMLSLNSYQLPQCHVHRTDTFRSENLQQFLTRKRTAVLRLV